MRQPLLAAAFCCCPYAGQPFAPLLPYSLHWQLDDKRRPLPHAAFHRQPPVVELHDLLHHGQAQAKSLGGMGGIPLIELVENLGHRFLIHATTLIHHLKYYVRTFDQWINSADMDQRKVFTKDFFDALEANGAKTIGQLSAMVKTK